jgi:RNA recognition motif-containing protein
MSLFVGNLSQSVKKSELEDVFTKFGACKIQLKVLSLIISRGFLSKPCHIYSAAPSCNSES